MNTASSSRALRVVLPVLSAAIALCAPHVLSTARAQSAPFTYQSEVKSEGTPAAGPHDMRFQLYDSASGGLQLSNVLCFDNTPLTNGRFTTVLNFTSNDVGPLLRPGREYWLDIAMRPETGLTCATAAGMTTLNPRQKITLAPLAAHATTASGLIAPDGAPANALTVDNDGNIGIRTSTPQATFDVANSNGTFLRFDSTGRLRMGGSGGGIASLYNDAPSNGLTAFFVSGSNPLNLGPGGVGIGGASPPASGLVITGPTIAAGSLTVNGALTIGSTTRNLMLHAAAFSTERGGSDTGWAPGQMEYTPAGITSYSASFNDHFIASLSLPDGATITNFVATVVDNVAGNDITAELGRTNFLTQGTNILASAASGSNSTAVQAIGTASIGFPTVDNNLHAYWVRVRLDGTSGVNYHRLIAVRITYTITQPLP